MKAHQKIMELTRRQAEAIQTATDRERQARKKYVNRLHPFTAFGLPLVLPLLGMRKARKAYETAQAQKMTIARQYAAILAAVPVDYYEPNTVQA